MALSAGLLGIEQRAVDIVRGVLGRPVADVGHVTVRAGDAGVVVCAAGGEHFIFGMLGLEHGGAGFGIFPILEAHVVVVGDDLVDARAVLPWEGQVFLVAGKVIFDMAVGANHGAHFLAGEGGPVLALGFQGVFERGVGDDQAHGPGFVAVGAADGILDVRCHVAEQHGIIGFHAHLLPQSRVVGGFAGIAGGGGCFVDAFDGR